MIRICCGGRACLSWGLTGGWLSSGPGLAARRSPYVVQAMTSRWARSRCGCPNTPRRRPPARRFVPQTIRSVSSATGWCPTLEVTASPPLRSRRWSTGHVGHRSAIGGHGRRDRQPPIDPRSRAPRSQTPRTAPGREGPRWCAADNGCVRTRDHLSCPSRRRVPSLITANVARPALSPRLPFRELARSKQHCRLGRRRRFSWPVLRESGSLVAVLLVGGASVSGSSGS